VKCLPLGAVQCPKFCRRPSMPSMRYSDTKFLGPVDQDKMQKIQAKFSSLYTLLAVVGTIDDMHVSMSEPDLDATDYFYFKTRGIL